MKLKQVGSNQALLIPKDGVQILFSYETPVAGRDSEGYFKTDKHYSRTTSRHISKYLAGVQARVVAQDFINAIVDE